MFGTVVVAMILRGLKFGSEGEMREKREKVEMKEGASHPIYGFGWSGMLVSTAVFWTVKLLLSNVYL